jgi:hypothetical protein
MDAPNIVLFNCWWFLFSEVRYQQYRARSLKERFSLEYDLRLCELHLGEVDEEQFSVCAVLEVECQRLLKRQRCGVAPVRHQIVLAGVIAADIQVDGIVVLDEEGVK